MGALETNLVLTIGISKVLLLCYLMFGMTNLKRLRSSGTSKASFTIFAP